MRRSPLSRLSGLALLAVLGVGCSGDSPPPPPLCPRVGIINGLEHMERPSSDAPGQPAFRAAMENMDGGCRGEGGDLVVEIAIDLVVQPGTVAAGEVVELPYFVVVSAPDGSLIDRQDYVARVSVPRGARRVGVTETFRQRFLGREAGAAQYEVLFGFALPEAEAMQQYRGG